MESTSTTADERLAAAIEAAVQRLDAPVKRGLSTAAGYGGAASLGVAWALERSTEWNLPPVLQVVLVGGAVLLTAVTGLGRQLQSRDKVQGLAQVAAAAVAPVQVPVAPVLSRALLGAPDNVTAASGADAGLPDPDEVL